MNKNYNELKILNKDQLELNYSINYVTEEPASRNIEKTPYFTGSSTLYHDFNGWTNNDNYPIFLSECASITIPKGIKRQIERLPKKVLSKIDADKNTAVEKCLIAASNLTSTLFHEDEEKWKSLSSKVLHEQLKKGNDNTFIYQFVVDALEYSTDGTLPILECKKNSYGADTYENGIISKQYKFSSIYQNKGVVTYRLKTPDSIDKRKKYLYTKLNEACNNPIGKNLIYLYQFIETPIIPEIINQGRHLSKQKFRTKKGKLLTYLNNKAKNYYTDFQDRSFVEDNLKMFEYLTSTGYMIPIIGNNKSGGRVVDSFNLMPSWIRQMCKIGNENICEIDYKALHPNIAIAIYGGKIEYLTHEKVASSIGKPIKEIKIEHLSFFNRHPNDMAKSVLHKYYYDSEREMLEKIIEDKVLHGYKYTSRLLFKKEVEIMTSCIERLNKKDVYVLYVYDALYCKRSQVDIVKEVMNDEIIKFGVYTNVK